MKTNEFYEVDGCTGFIPVKLIEEHKHMTNTLEVELTQTGYKTFVPSICSFPKPHEPQKPVIPKFVADWVEELKKSHSNLAWVWKVYPNEPEIKKWLESNTEKFMRAWLDGYEVEQEKLYTVEIPDPHGMYKIRYLFRNSAGNVRIGGTDYRDIFLDVDTHLTESEIRKDFDWAWDAGFAKEVE